MLGRVGSSSLPLLSLPLYLLRYPRSHVRVFSLSAAKAALPPFSILICGQNTTALRRTRHLVLVWQAFGRRGGMCRTCYIVFPEEPNIPETTAVKLAQVFEKPSVLLFMARSTCRLALPACLAGIRESLTLTGISLYGVPEWRASPPSDVANNLSHGDSDWGLQQRFEAASSAMSLLVLRIKLGRTGWPSCRYSRDINPQGCLVLFLTGLCLESNMERFVTCCSPPTSSGISYGWVYLPGTSRGAVKPLWCSEKCTGAKSKGVGESGCVLRAWAHGCRRSEGACDGCRPDGDCSIVPVRVLFLRYKEKGQVANKIIVNCSVEVRCVQAS